MPREGELSSRRREEGAEAAERSGAAPPGARWGWGAGRPRAAQAAAAAGQLWGGALGKEENCGKR